MAKKSMNVKWELDVPAMVAKLGEQRARQLWEQSKNKKDIKGKGFTVKALSSKVETDKPIKVRKVKGVTKVDVDQGVQIDKNLFMPEIMPFLKFEIREVGMEGAEEVKVDEKDLDKDIEEIDKTIESYRKEEGQQ